MGRRQAPVEGGTLYVVGTPIGNLEDITLRALRVLREVDLVAAEDTRAARVLLSHHGIETPAVSLHRDNEARRAEELLQRLLQGQAVALISEAGMPGVSDPGQRVIARCLEAGVALDVAPGPSAALTALVLAGLPATPWHFYGFLPRKGKARRRALSELEGLPGALVIYESPRRVAGTLSELQRSLGDRPAAVVREMTKLFQEAARGTLSELARRFAEQPPRGEVTLVLAGAGSPAELSDEQLRARVAARLQAGESPGQVSRALAHLGRRRVYQLALSLRPGGDPPPDDGQERA
jgi:16S rRNA (cytidine1402-2'-O)-methyltransferase